MGSPKGFDLNHHYAPSVIATYLSASNLITAVETLFEQEQQLSARFLHFWFNTFSAVVCRLVLLALLPEMQLTFFLTIFFRLRFPFLFPVLHPMD
jgi:hypothetical protein